MFVVIELEKLSRPNFQNLQVYQLAERLADAIWAIVNECEQFAKDTVGKQIVRAADSIGANIAEGAGWGSFQDNRRLVKMARSSLNETQHWLRRAYCRNLLTPQQVDKLKLIIEELYQFPLMTLQIRSPLAPLKKGGTS